MVWPKNEAVRRAEKENTEPLCFLNKEVVKLVIQDDYAYKYTLIWQAVFLLFFTLSQ